MAPSSPAKAIAIRRLAERDAAAYRHLRLETLRETPAAFTASYVEEVERPLPWTVARLTLPAPNCTLGAFLADSKLVGIAGLGVPDRMQERHKGMLFGMAVARESRGLGIGRALVQSVLEEARLAGLTQLVLLVSEGNTGAERLYRSLGFTEWGREPRAAVVEGRAVNKLHMIRMIDPAGD